MFVKKFLVFNILWLTMLGQQKVCFVGIVVATHWYYLCKENIRLTRKIKIIKEVIENWLKIHRKLKILLDNSTFLYRTIRQKNYYLKIKIWY